MFRSNQKHFWGFLFLKKKNHGTSVLDGLPKAPSSNQQKFF